MLRRLVTSSALGVLLGLAATGPAAAKVRWFHSPSGNLQCEVSADAAQGTRAYCLTFDRPRSVTLRRNGSMKVCRGHRCLSNGPEDAFTLRYGRSVRVGPFRCTSLERGMRCVVLRSGRGFLLSKERLQRL